ncbi:unnamed protein product [Adineta ricciae]|uniref:Uncharacterized protein n=1 Tax=Adineta ricciae TaxID=249248 RepID=A0A815VUK3_ADIRI|nr:unnamed protein product [Adineta ricciae]
METKKFKDLSSFGFYVGKEKTTTDALSYTDKENHTDSVMAIETNTSLNANDSRSLCTTNNLAPLTDPKATTAVTETSSSLQSSGSKNDIGNHINGRLSLSDDVRYLLLKQHFVPDGRLEWPFAERKTNNTIEKRFLRQKHLVDNKPWLVYSPAKAGLFCLPCVLIIRHKMINSHRDSLLAAEKFIEVYENKCDGIDDLLLAKHKLDEMDNRERVKPIIRTIILCGQNNIPLRGHRDDGDLNLNSDSIVACEGNFRALLRYRVDGGDSILAQHLSKATQNELIEVCGEFIREKAIEEVKQAKFLYHHCGRYRRR